MVFWKLGQRRKCPREGWWVQWGDAPAPAASLWRCTGAVLAPTLCVLGCSGCRRVYPQGEGAGTGRGHQGCVLVAPILRDTACTWGRNPSSSSPGLRHHPASSESTVPGKNIGAKRELVVNPGQPSSTPRTAGLGKAGYAGAAPGPCCHRAEEDISGPPRRKHSHCC